MEVPSSWLSEEQIARIVATNYCNGDPVPWSSFCDMALAAHVLRREVEAARVVINAELARIDGGVFAPSDAWDKLHAARSATDAAMEGK